MQVETSNLRPAIRAPKWNASIAASKSRETGALCGCSPAIQYLLTTGCEDLARFLHVLKDINCVVLLRCIDDSVVPLCGDEHQHSIDGNDSRKLEVPIFDGEGRSLASLSLAYHPGDIPDASRRLLLTLMQSTARSIAERLFRLRYCEYWVIAGLSSEDPHSTILLAVDSNRNVVGADHTMRELLKTQRADPPPPSLAQLFSIDIAAIASRHRDTFVSLRRQQDGVVWRLLITPPSVGSFRQHANGAFTHCRPRIDGLGSPRLMTRKEEPLGLPSRLVKRIEEYVDTHLESPLNIEELATTLGISISHFARSFRNAVGLTPHNYVMQRRLHRAQDLLLHSALPLVAIALQTGFSDQSHFSRRFHQLVGLPPKLFREHHGDESERSSSRRSMARLSSKAERFAARPQR
jgi:AraC-like DNA-binding protein